MNTRGGQAPSSIEPWSCLVSWAQRGEQVALRDSTPHTGSMDSIWNVGTDSLLRACLPQSTADLALSQRLWMRPWASEGENRVYGAGGVAGGASWHKTAWVGVKTMGVPQETTRPLAENPCLAGPRSQAVGGCGRKPRLLGMGMEEQGSSHSLPMGHVQQGWGSAHMAGHTYASMQRCWKAQVAEPRAVGIYYHDIFSLEGERMRLKGQACQPWAHQPLIIGQPQGPLCRAQCLVIL